MKKKGFTLIELLAVIIILAIVALIATPIILNVVDDAKESGRQSSMAMYANAIKLKLTEDWFKNGSYPTIDEAYLGTVQTSGNKVTCEEVKYSDVFGSVLHKCTVGNDSKEYYFAGNKVYESAEDETYKAIYDSVGNVVVAGKPVVDELLKQYNETNTVGLLKDDTGYYYKGSSTEVANNFVWFGGHLWRVVSIDNDNNLTMITQQPITNIQPASSVWTTQEQYEASYINHWLNSEEDGVFYKSLDKNDKSRILNSTFNVGIYNNASEITTTQKAGLLDHEQYIKAGGTNSFLDLKNFFWLGNRYNTSVLLYVWNDGKVYTTGYNSSDAVGVRPVIKISNIAFTTGNGTLSDPYRENSTSTNTSNIKVGEYISIPTTGGDCGTDKKCLFRVVSQDSNSIKVILNGTLWNISEFGSTVTYTNGNTVDTAVKAFADTINANYRYSGTDKTFGIGMYGDGANYTAVQTPTYTGNVGLPVVGEMFSGNDIDVGSTKPFVNVDTIENPTVSAYFWTMNAFDTTYLCYIYYTGKLITTGPLADSGVRPVLFLKNNLTFTGGEGTAEHPFTLE